MIHIKRFNPLTVAQRIFSGQNLSFLRENSKLFTQFIITLLSIGIGIWFIKNERGEIAKVTEVLGAAQSQLVLLGISLTIVYIILQGQMYVASFASIRHRISLWDATILFLKRNLISVFLPAGGVSSLAFFTGDIEKKGITKSHINFASMVYGFVGILSIVIVGIPVFIYAFLIENIGRKEWVALGGVLFLILFFYSIYRSLLTKGIVFKLIIKYFPSFEVLLGDIQNNRIERKHFFLTLFYSVLIEFSGIAHLYVAMIALGYPPSLFAAFLGYIISVIFLIVSPLFRGLGAIEVSMVYILSHAGFSDVSAIAITFLYRFFEFWLPLLAGVVSFILKINKLLMRVIPALLLFSLGIVNIISVLTPAVAERVLWLKHFLPVDAIVVSNYFVLVLGLFLLVTASFMLKGLKIAWWFAMTLSVISMIANLTKAVDYEEATLALFVIAGLIMTRKDYYVQNSPRLRSVGIQTAVLSIIAVLIYSIVGFYYLDKRHFNVDFSFWESVKYSLQNYFLIGSSDLIPLSRFAERFLLSINVSGFISLSVLVYTLIRPYFFRDTASPEELEKPKELVSLYGKSALDYFKTYEDKMIFNPEGLNAFISYRTSGNFAVVLENPVAENDQTMQKCISLFDKYCYETGLKSFYYRVPEESLPVYRALRKKVMFIGQEGVVDLNAFTLEGGSKKSIRNAISKVKDRGYTCHVHQPPVKDGLLQKLKSVSDEWLEETGRSEILFSQGMFSWNELKQQTLLTVENSEEKIIAFLNVIPDHQKGEGTYDLLRKTSDAPNGVMDFILVELFSYLKSQDYIAVNLGFAPLSGLNDPHTFSEKSMKFAYEKIRGFSQYKGLREYKEKFVTSWYNKYLVYEHDYDLLQIPGALNKVIKP